MTMDYPNPLFHMDYLFRMDLFHKLMLYSFWIGVKIYDTADCDIEIY